jgi:endoglucanase
MGVKTHPIGLDNVIYSPHVYGPDLYRHQPWFKDPNFPNNLPDVWDKYWGFVEKKNFGRLWIGEFGTDDTGADTKQGQWYNTLLNYMDTYEIEFCYWAFNSNEGNRYGILKKRDWSTVDQGTDTAKWDSLSQYLQGDTSNPILYADP